VTDAAAVIERARAEAPAAPAYGAFSALLRTPGGSTSVLGALVVSAPDRFRVELRGPIGPAQVILTCNGKDVTAWVAPKNTFFRIAEADEALGGLVGDAGADGAAIAASLLLGRLPPLPGAPELRAAGSVATASWAREDGARFEAGVEGRYGRLATARATSGEGLLLFDAAWEPGPFPAAMRVELPTLGVVADVKFSPWTAAEPPDTAFEGAPPNGAEVRDVTLADLVAPPPR
jgi:hypothetical protein